MTLKKQGSYRKSKINLKSATDNNIIAKYLPSVVKRNRFRIKVIISYERLQIGVYQNEKNVLETFTDCNRIAISKNQ